MNAKEPTQVRRDWRDEIGMALQYTLLAFLLYAGLWIYQRISGSGGTYWNGPSAWIGWIAVAAGTFFIANALAGNGKLRGFLNARSNLAGWGFTGVLAILLAVGIVPAKPLTVPAPRRRRPRKLLESAKRQIEKEINARTRRMSELEKQLDSRCSSRRRPPSRIRRTRSPIRLRPRRATAPMRLSRRSRRSH